jgi:hypothetical protein
MTVHVKLLQLVSDFRSQGIPGSASKKSDTSNSEPWWRAPFETGTTKIYVIVF